MTEDRIKRGMDLSLIWTSFLIIIEICLIWALASQFSYLVLVNGDSSAVHYFVLFGIVFLSGFLAITIGIAGSRSQERWGTERCRVMLGTDSRLLYKGEVYVIWCIVLGTMIGTGVWDLVTVINALVDNNWDLSVFQDNYIFLELGFFQIVWALWIQALVGGITAGIGIGIGIYMASKVNNDTFCEPTL